jgi:hypothetical protein
MKAYLKTSAGAFTAVIACGIISWAAIIASLCGAGLPHWLNITILLTFGILMLCFAEGFFQQVENFIYKLAEKHSWNRGPKYWRYKKLFEGLAIVWISPALFIFFGSID